MDVSVRLSLNISFNSTLIFRLFLVLIPEQALAPAPPPVTSANFISEIGPVRKTTERFKGNWQRFLYSMTERKIMLCNLVRLRQQKAKKINCEFVQSVE